MSLLSGENKAGDDIDHEKYFMEKPLVIKSWRETQMKWIALAFACIMMLGNYMSYDFPSYL